MTTTDAGMAVPDWPSTYGYNLFLYPWQTWLFGPWDLFVEHGHRLLGATVGLLTMGTMVAIFLADTPRWLRLWSVIALFAVIGQGVLGGLRVLWDQRTLALIHGCTGPLFFCLAVGLAVTTSRYWHGDPLADARRRTPSVTRRFQVLTLMIVCLAFLQLILGATLRHMPVVAPPSAFGIVVVFHLLTALVLALHAGMLAWIATSKLAHVTLVRTVAQLLAVAVLLQIMLGLATWVMKYSLPVWFGDYDWVAGLTLQAGGWLQTHTVTLHVAAGSFILALSVMLSLYAFAGRVAGDRRSAPPSVWQGSEVPA